MGAALLGIVVAAVVAALIFYAARLVLATRRREQVRRQLSPYLAEAELARSHHRSSIVLERVGAHAEALLTRMGSLEAVQLHIDRAGLDVRAGAFVCLDALAGFAAFVLLLNAKSIGVAMLGGAAAILAPWLVLHVRALKRSRAFERQLPEILDTLAASLRAGHGFDHGLQTVATDLGEPAGREFKRVVAEVHLGRSLEDALAELGRRIRSADLQFVLDAIAIQRQVGGSLAELFELVATTVRSREQFRRNLRAITGQVRISANVLTGLPIVAAVLLTLVNPSYMSPLWNTSSGHILALVALSMIVCGSLVLRRVGKVRW
jgi:tight adherence protein B